MDLRNNIIRMCPNIKAMLIDRGYTPDSIPNTDFTNILEYKIKEFMDDDADTTRILDFLLQMAKQRTMCFFIKVVRKALKLIKSSLRKKCKNILRKLNP